ncbi:GNAT family N-acetyltransferase [Pseudarthrobacter sp. NPDC092419]|uniref:GNAT family N-acetyltransferase n=1 Tax=Pseudarthrobacter sp. NPDC092419 TaxID=3364414 RepID=UPI003809E2F9
MLRFPEILPALKTSTGRFTLTPFSTLDVEPLARILGNDDIWAQGFGDGESRPANPAELNSYIHRRFAGLPIFAIYYTGLPGGPLFAGTTGVTEVTEQYDRVKVGRTVINPAFWGTGANHEVKTAVFDWLFAMGAGRLECDVDPRNERSIRSLIRFGFTVEGTRRRSSPRANGTWRDIVVLSLLVEEWPETRQRAVHALDGRTGWQVPV